MDGWVKATAASVIAETTRPTLVVTSRLRLSRRSVTRPASGLRTIAGPNTQALATPTAVPLSVISNTAQMTARRCIQVPIWLTVWPVTKMRKSRTARDRKVPRSDRNRRVPRTP